MFDKPKDKDRGQVGIGTLIVFIAMVLVAAIAAGVLINTAGFLQSKSEQTGQESGKQVTNRVTVQSVTSTDLNPDSGIASMNVLVSKASGSENVDMEDMTIQYVGPQEAQTLIYGDTASASEFSVSAEKDTDDSLPVLNDNDDRFTVSIDVNSIRGSSDLPPGSSAELRFTTAAGGSSQATITVPESLSGKSAVSL